MSKNRNRHKKSEWSNKNPDGWPVWFKPITHSVEREVLAFAFKKNERLGEVYFIIQSMQINYILFRRNFEELERLQNQFNQPLIFQELALETEKAQEIVQDVILEFTRLLHNFLAAAKMLVDVTRTWVKKEFEGKDFFDSYQDEITKRFINNIHAKFLGDLRNFTLHRTLPLAMPELRMQKVSEHELKSSLGIVLLKNHLLEWDEWSDLGRMEIQMAIEEEEIDIQSILNQYFKNVTEFTQWLFWQVKDLFGKEISQINTTIESVSKKP